jgi:hypothetical protein
MAPNPNKVSYVDDPHPHPQAGDAPRTGVPVNPVSPKVGSITESREIMQGEK